MRLAGDIGKHRELRSRERHAVQNRRKLLGFFLFPIALFPLLALVSYRWQAMAALNIPPEASSNLIGVVGDTFAYYGYQLIGLAVWAVPPLTLFLGLLASRFVRADVSWPSSCSCSRPPACFSS